MYPQQLDNNNRYRFTNQQIFQHEAEIFRGFIQYNYTLGMHVQEFFELNIILRGDGMHYIGNRRIPVKRGDVFIIPPNTPHGYAGGDGFDVYHLVLSQNFMQKYTSDLQKLPSFLILFKIEPLMRTEISGSFHLTLSDIQLKSVEELLTQIKDHSGIHTASAAVIRNSLTMVLITALCDIYTEKNAEGTDQSAMHDSAFADSLAFIYERYHEKINICDLAKIANLSRSSFIRKFREICKVSPAKFIVQQRTESAKQLLAHTGLSVQEIAAKTGFYDTSHFIKTFARETGMTPNAYRKESRQ